MRFIFTVLFVTIGISHIHGLTYYRARRTDTATVAESIKREAEEEAMRRADEMPMMETARRMRTTNPAAADRILVVIGKSTTVRRAAAEGAVKKAVEMGAVKRLDEAKMVERFMDSPLVEKAAIDGALRVADEEPIITSKRNQKLRMDDGRQFDLAEEILTKRDNEVIKRTVEEAAKTKAEDILVDATEGKPLRSDEVKPIVNALKNSEELRQVGADAVVFATRRMNTPITRTDLEHVKRSDMVREAVETGVLRAIEDLGLVSPSSRGLEKTVTTIDNAAKRSITFNRAVMEAAMDAAGRSTLMKQAAESDSASAVELVKKTAEKPIVRLEAAKRAMEIALDNGMIDKRSASSETLREVADLPSIRNIAAVGAVKKAVEMGVTA